MSIITTLSIRAVAGSIDGTLAGRSRKPLKLAGNIMLESMLERYLADRQRYELIACSHPMTSPATSPHEDIKVTKKKIKKLGKRLARAQDSGT